MRFIPAVTAGSAILAFLACVGDYTASPERPEDDGGVEATSPVSSDGGPQTNDAGAEDAAVADADVDAGPSCVTGQPRSETRFTNRLRSIGPLTATFGFVTASGPGWLNPANGKTSDDQFTTVSFPLDAGGAPNNESLFLVADRFGFDLPPAAEISGIEVQLEWRGNATNDGGPNVQGGTYGLTKAGVLYQANTSVDLPTTEAITRFGDASALWGSSWDAPDLNDAGFGTAVLVRPKSPKTKVANVFVDAVAITVTYICP